MKIILGLSLKWGGVDYQEPTQRRNGTIAGELGQILDTKRRLREVIAQYNDIITEQTPFRQYAQLIREIVTAPTLAGLKKALNRGNAAEKYPIGTEIEDTWNGQSNPLTVAHYTNITLANGTVKPGAYLVRKYVEPVSQQYSTTQYRYYTNSAVKAYLEGEYLQKCSAETKGLISQIKIIWMEPNYLGGFDRKEMAARFFLMSGIEIGGTKNTGEGVFWSYWKQKLGISTPSDQYTNKRIVRSRDGVARRISLRTNYPSGGMDWTSYVGTVGEVSNGSLNDEYGVLPACAIVAD